MEKEQLRLSVPGRIVLFGEHQDYFALPVISAGINLRMRFEGFRISGPPRFLIEAPDIGMKYELDAGRPGPYSSSRDYLQSALNLLLKKGVRFPCAWRVCIRSEIPIGKGVSSSSAMVIGWLRFLAEVGEGPVPDSPHELAMAGYQAEVVEFGESGGMQDHFACAYGMLRRIECKPPYKSAPMDNPPTGLILVDSGSFKETVETIRRNRSMVERGMDRIRQRLGPLDIGDLDLDLARKTLGDSLHEMETERLLMTLETRDLTRKGAAILKKTPLDYEALGNALTEQHVLLRDGMNASTPVIEQMIEAARGAGSSGSKINGSGGGGCFIALAPGSENSVVAALRRLGARTYRIEIAGGVQTE